MHHHSADHADFESPQPAASDPSPKVAIVGAGIAGLECARSLKNRGFDVTIFEKSRGVGGRMATRRSDVGVRFDHGAQYFTARDACFQKAVATWVEAGIVSPWDGRICTLTHGTAEPKERTTQRFVGLPGMNGVCRHLAVDAHILLRVRVHAVDRVDNRWRLLDEDATELGLFDYFLTTAPAPQSADLLSPAPHLQQIASSVLMQGCWAAMLAFENPLDVEFDGAFVVDSPLSWIARNSSKPERELAPESWVLHASPEWTTAHLEQTAEEVLPQLLHAFWEATGHTTVEPTFSTVHRWRYAIPPEPLTQPYLFDPTSRIGAAGDWCNGPRVEGAFLSGNALAAAVADEVTATCNSTTTT